MYKLEKSIFIILFLFFSCKRKTEEPSKLISPAEILKIYNYSEYITESDNLSDSLSSIEDFVSVKNFKVIATKNSIHFFENISKKILKSYKFKFASSQESNYVDFSANANKSKLLVTTHNSESSITLVFQIDLNSFQIDWLTKYSMQIQSVCYSNNSNLIALGTNYNLKEKKENTSEYYSTLFLLDSKTGKFVDYFEQGESVCRIKFSEDNNSLFAVLGWPHVDTFVWNINNTKEKRDAFGKDETPFYDACILDKDNFLSVGADGIYKWNLSNPNNQQIVYTNKSKYFNAYDKIYKLKDVFILVDYQNGTSNPPVIRYINSKFELTDSIKMNSTLDKVTIYDFKLQGIGSKNSIICLDIKSKSLTETIFD